MSNELKIVACPGAKQFSTPIVKFLKKRNPKTRLVECEFFTFKNTEVKTVLKEPIRGSDVYIIQDITNKETGSINDNLMTLFTTIDTCTHASCEEVNVIIPTFPYARQHKKTQREGLTASLISHFIEFMGVKRIITLDIHSREIQNSFSKTIMENLHASFEIVQAIMKLKIPLDNLTVVAPDIGSIARNTFFANALRRPVAMMYKERDFSKANVILSQKLLGDVSGKDILITDDMCDTGGTTLRAAKELKNLGANDIYMAFSLPFFNGNSIPEFREAFNNGVIKGVLGTNAVYNPNLWSEKWFFKVHVNELFADVIFRLHEKISISELLDNKEEFEVLFRENQ